MKIITWIGFVIALMQGSMALKAADLGSMAGLYRQDKNEDFWYLTYEEGKLLITASWDYGHAFEFFEAGGGRFQVKGWKGAEYAFEKDGFKEFKEGAFTRKFVRVKHKTLEGGAAGQGVLTRSWTGEIKSKAGKTRVRMGVWQNADLSYSAMLLREGENKLADYPVQWGVADQGASMHLRNGLVDMELPRAAGMFLGRLNADGSEINGIWCASGEGVSPFSFRRLDASRLEPKRPQEPKEPYPYLERDVSYTAAVKLSGTLTLPKGNGPFPAVLLLSGSWPEDRDESGAGHKPFLVLADTLTRRGMAVLRVDDRGVGLSGGEKDHASLDELADDAMAGLAFLKKQKEVDPARVGIVGHSEGGTVAAIVASRGKEPAFVLSMAGPAYSMRQGWRDHYGKKLKKDGVNGELSQWVLQLLERLMDASKDPKAALEKLVKVEVAKLDEARLKALGGKEAAEKLFAPLLEEAASPHYRSYLSYDPAVALSKVSCPLLTLGGDQDKSVNPKSNQAAVLAAAKGNPLLEFRLLPGVSHAFQDCPQEGGCGQGDIENTYSPKFLKIMGDWVLKHSGH